MGQKEILETPLDDIYFGDEAMRDGTGVRAWNALKKCGCQTLGDITRLTSAELLKRKNIGRGTLATIRAFLAQHSLTLKDERPVNYDPEIYACPDEIETATYIFEPGVEDQCAGCGADFSEHVKMEVSHLLGVLRARWDSLHDVAED